MLKNIIKKLPGYNCGKCGYSRCDEFADALLNKDKAISDCPVLLHEEYKEKRISINDILNDGTCKNRTEKIVGLIDSYQADITLEPLAEEHSCREVLLPMSSPKVYVNDIIRYRPLGCPITHFAKIIEINNMLLSVHIIGPCNRLNNEDKFVDIGTCMVIAFHGKYK
ncbi:MAG: (Fe-S)-binding protein, partial [Bacteroidota bacterium]|nr:(Fe-S)-binding protein [Bacteroidota bacterium]